MTVSRVGFLSVTPLVPAGPSLADALDLYTRLLGFELVWEGAEMAGVRRGAVEFNLVRNSNRAWAENASFSVAVPDLEALHAEYREVDVQVGPLEMKDWGRREFHMILPSGVCLQFFERTS